MTAFIASNPCLCVIAACLIGSFFGLLVAGCLAVAGNGTDAELIDHQQEIIKAQKREMADLQGRLDSVSAHCKHLRDERRRGVERRAKRMARAQK